MYWTLMFSRTRREAVHLQHLQEELLRLLQSFEAPEDPREAGSGHPGRPQARTGSGPANFWRVRIRKTGLERDFGTSFGFGFQDLGRFWWADHLHRLRDGRQGCGCTASGSEPGTWSWNDRSNLSIGIGGGVVVKVPGLRIESWHCHDFSLLRDSPWT